MDNIIEFIMFKILMPVFVFGVLIFVVYVIIAIPLSIKQDQEKKTKVEECFMQEPRTKECEFVLWQHELTMKKPKSRTTVMPMPVVVR